MNTRIGLSLLSIVAAAAMIAGATFAFFTDTATSTGNTFSVGTMNLLVDDADEPTPAPTVTGSLSIGDLAPGGSTTGFVSLHNGGTIPIAEVELGLDSVLTDSPDSPGGDLRDVLNVTVLVDDTTPDSACVGGTNITSTVDTGVGNGTTPLTLKEFDDGGTDVYDALLTGTGLAGGATRNVCFTVAMDSGAGDVYQGDSVSTTIGLTANQDATQ